MEEVGRPTNRQQYHASYELYAHSYWISRRCRPWTDADRQDGEQGGLDRAILADLADCCGRGEDRDRWRFGFRPVDISTADKRLHFGSSIDEGEGDTKGGTAMELMGRGGVFRRLGVSEKWGSNRGGAIGRDGKKDPGRGLLGQRAFRGEEEEITEGEKTTRGNYGRPRSTPPLGQSGGR